MFQAGSRAMNCALPSRRVAALSAFVIDLAADTELMGSSSSYGDQSGQHSLQKCFRLGVYAWRFSFTRTGNADRKAHLPAFIEPCGCAADVSGRVKVDG
jgi:hypothetical protein